MGVLRVEKARGEEVFSFSYDKSWLASGHVHLLDPDLQLFAGPQYLPLEKANFGLFLDSSPDRWGRTLMDRREAILARKEGREPRTLMESDYLVGVHDETRMGALRFRQDPTGPFLADDPSMKAPPITSIRELEHASLHLEEDDFDEDAEAWQWLRILIAPGSSLGGARPKANVRDPQGCLWIAKFPSKHDRFNSGAWEFVLHGLASELGIRVPEARAELFTQTHHTFLARRFDRNNKDQRVHFASAMTMLGLRDGHDFQAGGSYLDIAAWIERYGAKPQEDLRELWKRIVFSVLVSNTDDHLRNHGFLLSPAGWHLAPAYDLNPDPRGSGLSLNISETDNSLSTDLCLEVSTFYRWPLAEATTFLKQAKTLINGSWEQRASALGISSGERAAMAPAFRNSR